MVNTLNPISYVIEADRALMFTGYDWESIGQALLSIAIVGAILQAGTLWGPSTGFRADLTSGRRPLAQVDRSAVLRA